MKALNFIIILLVICSLFTNSINAQQTDTTSDKSQTNLFADNTRTSIYFHPITLLAGLASDLFLLYSTIELPQSISNSLIIKPSIWYFTGYNSDIDLSDVLRLGADVGIRHFPSEKSEGLYLQGQAGLFFLSAENKSSLWLDIMGYLGYSKKYSGVRIFVDVGVGIGMVENRAFLFDVNLGIGFPIGKGLAHTIK